MSIFTLFLISLFITVGPRPDLENSRFEIYLQKDHSWLVKEKGKKDQWRFTPDFVILSASENPQMAMRPAGIENVRYNVVTWKSAQLDAADQLKQQHVGKEVGGDGFDDRILKGKTDLRTADVFKAGHLKRTTARKHEKRKSKVIFSFPATDEYSLTATLSFEGKEAFPKLRYTLEARTENYYSVGYTGAPAVAIEDASAIWQPMIWQEKRFPQKSFLTLAFQCPVPSTLVCASGSCSGVVGDPKELPFDPLPLLDNSRFGIALRDEQGKAKSMLFAPALGGAASLMKTGTKFTFDMLLYVGTEGLSAAYEDIARDIYKFGDYRKNTTFTLNETLDNMMDYGMSSYSMFIDSLKGCAYSTDVPGAVKNVSSLNPLQMALLTDREDIYWKRAYPIMEFLLSREKFLFTLDSTQKIQNPSRRMKGPTAPVSELAALYEISGGQSQALLDLAMQEYTKGRVRNLSVEENGNSWQNALALYHATGEQHYLDKAIRGADQYLSERVDHPSEDFHKVETAFFFWTGFTPDWINMFMLYEATGAQKYLDAAQKGARQYTQFAWYAPMIPDDSILVNKGNKAPVYWYLKKKGHKQMAIPEEVVPAWQLSEIGLTPESSGTCSGHRAIFMANYAPWMLRIGHLKNDTFLKQTAKAAIIGRYANFPGYHINTARTTAYKKEDYPLRPFKELSVNSFHFNHIWPHMSILVDYLFTDAFVKSNGAINVPSSYIQGYAYLQSKFYGFDAGEFYGEKEVYPWMPPALLQTDSKQLNYVAFRGNNSMYIAFLNQAPESITTTVYLNADVTGALQDTYTAKIWVNNQRDRNQTVTDGKFSVQVRPTGITAVKIEGINPETDFQKKFYAHQQGSAQGLRSLKEGKAKAMVIDFGKGLRTLYVYLQEDDRVVKNSTLEYTLAGKPYTVTDNHYPFEFTVRLPEGPGDMKCRLRVTHTNKTVAVEDFAIGLPK